MKTASKIFCLFWVLALSALPSRAEIQIGVAGPLTGEFAPFGEQMVIGARVAAADINARGGILGEPVTLVTSDDKCDAEEAKAVANQMVGSGVSLVVGNFCFSATLASAPILAERSILQITLGTTLPQLTDDRAGPGLFRLAPRDDEQAAAIVEGLAKDLSDARIAIVHDKSAYGKALADAVRAQLNERGIRETIYEAIDPGAPEYQTLGSILQLDNVEVLVFGGYHPEAASLQREFARRGLTIQMIGGDALGTDEFWLLSGEAGEGTLFALPPNLADLASAKGFAERLAEADVVARGYDVATYAAIELWAKAVEQAGTLDFEAVGAALADGQFETLLGAVSFDEKGDRSQPGYVLHLWSGGRYAPVGPKP
ncbi:branched-chain amino acid ABC transporter substrate-binding protein [Roseibium sp. TrichSKD4]|uniref:branched-chain amino acid ABC transporter substrate-binding protein n=1 Tax=Roseibium sp. TrichSKD4 TaxID=744980 RepID=UPI00058D40E6|nr:branched-chain amino acid ABC transporter substrate-binding protein [Roseibium sp. TrichSKD4]